MHYVLAWWFEEKVKPAARGYCDLVIYADDFVVCFQYKDDAERFYERLKRRMGNFGLSLEEEKSRLIEFGRFATRDRARKGEGKPETFTFLGFTHYCSSGRNGKFRVKRKTSRKKFNKKCKEVRQKIKKMRTLSLKTIVQKLNQILVGYYHYYGITDNYHGIKAMFERVKWMLFYWLNRRSQRKSYTWNQYHDVLKAYPLARPKVYVSIYE